MQKNFLSKSLSVIVLATVLAVPGLSEKADAKTFNRSYDVPAGKATQVGKWYWVWKGGDTGCAFDDAMTLTVTTEPKNGTVTIVPVMIEPKQAFCKGQQVPGYTFEYTPNDGATEDEFEVEAADVGRNDQTHNIVMKITVQ